MAILHKSLLCPSCSSVAIRKSRRKGLLERILYSAVFITPYRCKTCDYRYYRFRFPISLSEKHPRHAA
jgi:C4-type Zn-finger protein